MEDIVDAYAFHIHCSPVEQTARLVCAKRESERQRQWAKLSKGATLTASTLKRYVRKGIPVEHRPHWWIELSGANRKRVKFASNYFADKSLAGECMPAIRQVELDLPRTFPAHPVLTQPEWQQALRSTLAAVIAHNPQDGYCQGMSYVVGLLLLVLRGSPEDAFWVFVALTEEILYPATYATDLTGTHVEMRALEQLVAAKLPRLFAHLQSLHCDMSIIATDWYLCLFCTSFPSETAARVWDSMFMEGPKVLYRVALAVLKQLEPLILSKDNAGEVLKAVKDAAARWHDRDSLMETAFNGIGPMPMARIVELRTVTQAQVNEMLAARESARNAQQRRQQLSSVINEAQRKHGRPPSAEPPAGADDDSEPTSTSQSLQQAAAEVAQVAATSVQQGVAQAGQAAQVAATTVQQGVAHAGQVVRAVSQRVIRSQTSSRALSLNTSPR